MTKLDYLKWWSIALVAALAVANFWAWYTGLGQRHLLNLLVAIFDGCVVVMLICVRRRKKDQQNASH